MFRALRTFHKQLLDQAAGVGDKSVVVALADLADFGKPLDAELASAIAKDLEGVLTLARQLEVTHEAHEVVGNRGISKVLGMAEGGSSRATNPIGDVAQ